MKELEESAKKDLIGFYSYYINNDIDETLKELAQNIESKYLHASTLLSDDLNQLIHRLVDFYVSTGIKPPTKEESKKILENLKKVN